MTANGVRLGDYYAYCDVCGRRFFASRLVLRWDGLRVCRKDWEARPAQEFVKGIPDPVPPPWVRPEPATVYELYCTAAGSSAMAGEAVSGCMRPGQYMYFPAAPYCTLQGSSAMVGIGVVGCIVVGEPLAR